MKVSQIRNIAKFVLALFIATLLAVPYSALADCESEKNAVGDRERDVQDAERRLSELEERGYGTAIGQGGLYGMGIGFVGGIAVGLASGPGVVVTAAKGAIGGGITGSIWGGLNHYENLQSARDDLEYYQSQLSQAQAALEACKDKTPNCPYCQTGCSTCTSESGQTYEYHCPSCGMTWTFGSSERFMNFTHNHQ